MMNKRLLIRGGSIAAGYGVKTGYAEILQRYGAERGVEVINRSRPRENSFHGIWSFSDDIEPYRPDILLIHFGVDDAYAPVYRSEFKENLVCMVRRARELFSPQICLITSHTFDDLYDMDAVNIFYRAIREVAVDLECHMIPVHTYWAGILFEQDISNNDLLQKDTRYPNDEGHKVFAEAIIHRLDHLLGRTGSGD